MHHLGGNEIRIAEQFVGLRHMARGQCIAHRAGGDPPVLMLERRHHVDRKAVVGTLRHQEVRGAAPRLAEMEVEADHGAGDGEPVDQDLFDELLGGEPGQRRVEGEQDRAVQAGRGEQPELGCLRGEVERGLVRAEKRAGMRLEGEHRRGSVRRLGALHSRPDHRAMTAMDAIEIADGDDRPDQAIEARSGKAGDFVAHDDEGMSGMGFGHVREADLERFMTGRPSTLR